MSAVKFDKRLTSILLKRKKIDQEPLDDVVTRAESEGQSLTAVLIETKSVSEEDLLVAGARNESSSRQRDQAFAGRGGLADLAGEPG